MWRASIYTCTASSTESSFWVSRWLYSILPCIRANNTVDRAYGGISAGYRDYTRGVYWSACPVWTLECWISLPRFLAQRRKTVRGDRIGIGCCVLNAYCLCVGLCFCIELCVFPHRRVPLIFVSIIQLIGFIKTASGVSISISPTHSHTLVYLPPCENEHWRTYTCWARAFLCYVLQTTDRYCCSLYHPQRSHSHYLLQYQFTVFLILKCVSC